MDHVSTVSSKYGIAFRLIVKWQSANKVEKDLWSALMADPAFQSGRLALTKERTVYIFQIPNQILDYFFLVYKSLIREVGRQRSLEKIHEKGYGKSSASIVLKR